MVSFFRWFENLISDILPFSLIIFGGLYLTLKGKFFQLRGTFRSFALMKKAILNSRKNKKVSSFTAACTALAATVGTGNIAGVAGAVSIGGAGAVFWMWVSAFMGMAIKFGEITISVLHRRHGGEFASGGPMYYIKNPVLAFAFALSVLPAAFAGGNITQINAVLSPFNLHISAKFLIGIFAAILTAFILKGGIGLVGKITEKILPFMSVMYIILCFGVIAYNIDFLPNAFKMIMVGAFTPRAVTGGAVGSFFATAFIGASRGVFSNEAGLGTSGMIHSAADDALPSKQGFFGIFEVFLDTMVICTLTALTILCSGVNINYGNIASTELVLKALSSVYGSAAQVLLTVMMAIFAYSSVLGWSVYADTAALYLSGTKGQRFFKLFYPIGCVIGAVFTSNMAWRLAAFFNGLMLCVNMPSVLLLAEEFLKYKRGTSNDRKNKSNSKSFR